MKASAENRGMGLANICEMVERSGGTIHIVSRRGFYTKSSTGGATEVTAEDLPGESSELDGTLVVVDLQSTKT